jgi:hypothetical protein
MQWYAKFTDVLANHSSEHTAPFNELLKSAALRLIATSVPIQGVLPFYTARSNATANPPDSITDAVR